MPLEGFLHETNTLDNRHALTPVLHGWRHERVVGWVKLGHEAVAWGAGKARNLAKRAGVYSAVTAGLNSPLASLSRNSTTRPGRPPWFLITEAYSERSVIAMLMPSTITSKTL